MSNIEAENTDVPSGGFVAGTLVNTNKGLVPIQKIKVGDLLLCRPETGGNLAYKKVLRTLTNENRLVCVVFMDPKEELEAAQREDRDMREDLETAIIGSCNQPVWVTKVDDPAMTENESVGWARVDALNPGDELETSNKNILFVSNTQLLYRTSDPDVGWADTGFKIDYGRKVDLRNNEAHIDPSHEEFYNDDNDCEEDEFLLRRTVYNLIVEDFCTYYVGDAGVWTSAGNAAVEIDRAERIKLMEIAEQQEALRLRHYRSWIRFFGEECGPEKCGAEGCERLRIQKSKKCRRHEYSNINGGIWPYDDLDALHQQ